MINSWRGGMVMVAVMVGCSPPAQVEPVARDLAVAWRNAVGVAATPQRLVKVSNPPWNAGASSVQAIDGDGYMEFTTEENTTAKLAGLGNGDTDQSAGDVEFAIDLESNGRVDIVESGQRVANHVANYVVGDVFRVSVAANVVTYSKNGSPLYTSSRTPTFPLVIDTSLFTRGATISSVVLHEVDRAVIVPTFAAGVDYAIPLNGGAIKLADLNRDGRPDAIVTTSEGISLLFGNANGTFQPPVTIDAGAPLPDDVAVGDLDGDGTLDLVTVGQGSTPVRVILGNGDGTFRSATSWAAAGSFASEVAIGDLDGNGTLDLAVSNWADNAISVLLNDGHGRFSTVTNYATNTNPGSIAIADLDGDGRSDVVVATLGGYGISVLRGAGHGVLRAPVEYYMGYPGQVVLRDLNRDGVIDAVMPNCCGSTTVAIALGNGDGTFQPATTVPAGIGPQGVAVDDVSGDGIVDLVVTDNNFDSFGLTVAVLVGNGDGTFQPPRQYSAGRSPAGVAIADLNGDGRPDFVVANNQSLDISVFINTTGLPQPPVALAISRIGTGTGRVTSAPAGIDCGADCSELYSPFTSVTLTAVAATGSTFTGWSGGRCSGTGPCTVSLEAATTIAAKFTTCMPSSWNLGSDFQIAPNQQNPSPDSCGRPAVWSYLESATLARDPSTYTLLGTAVTSFFSIDGLEGWLDPSAPSSTLHVIYNATGAAQMPFDVIPWPVGAVLVHPSPDRLIMVGWRSPITGTVSVAASWTPRNVCGNGVAWFVARGATDLAGGVIDIGGSAGFASDVAVVAGEFLYFIVDPRDGNYGCDSTQVDVSIVGQ